MNPMQALFAAALFVAGAAAAAEPVVIRQHEALALAPDGNRVVDVEALDPGDLTEEPHGSVVVRAANGKVLAQYDPCAACRYADTGWAPRADAFAFVGTDFKAGKATLYVVSAGKLRAGAAIDGVANTVRWSPDGGAIALLVTQGAHKKTGAVEAGAALVGEIGESNDEQRIATVPAAGGELTLVSPADTYVYEFDWMPDASGFVATAAKGNGDANWWVATLDHVDRKSGTSRTIAAPPMQIDLPRVSPDGKTVAFVGGLMSDWGAIGGDVYTVPVAGGTPLNLTPDFKGTFRALAWRGKHLETAALIDDRSAVVSLDPATRRTTVRWSAPVAAEAQTFDGAIAFSADGNIAAAIVEDFTHAPEIVVGRLPTLAPVTHDNAALGAHVSVQSVHWRNEGFDIQGWLVGPPRPDSAQKHPLILVVHGGPSSASLPRYIAAGGQHGNRFDFTHELVQRGWYFFYPNPRGSYGQGEAFTRANVRDFGGGDLRDDLAGIDAAEKLAPIDDARLALYGHSYGGWMAMWANTQTRRFKAMIAGAGIANWISYYGQNGIDAWMTPFFGASMYDDPEVYRKSSPIEFIRNAKTPTLVYVGERDVECPAPQSLEYWHALKALGTPTQLMIYAGEGHHFRDPKHLEDLRARIVGWFERYLR